MTIRIQPRDIEVPADNPFEHDLLGREEPIKALTNVISSLDGPCVMAVDAGWGLGKTTFLKIWAQHLRNERFPVVEFNAWETDFAQDPFIALYSEITGGLSELPGASRRIDARRLRTAAGMVLRALPGAGIRVALSAVPHAGSQLVHEVSRDRRRRAKQSPSLIRRRRPRSGPSANSSAKSPRRSPVRTITRRSS